MSNDVRCNVALYVGKGAKVRLLAPGTMLAREQLGVDADEFEALIRTGAIEIVVPAAPQPAAGSGEGAPEPPTPSQSPA